MRPSDLHDGKRHGRDDRRLPWSRVLAAALWLTSILFVAQFALASARELEPQASALGWLLVAILLLAGLAVWGTDLLSRQD
jgi:hypothetical protein